MALQIYNTLTRSKEEFVPLVANRVHIYVCGPTVYGHPHIGHAKSYISFDVVVRYFNFLGYNVKYVQNITDVGHLTDDADEGEDKIAKQAREEKIDPMQVAESYTWSYFDDMQALGVRRADIFPRATGHITEQIEMIRKLLEKGFAYEVNGNVYYDVSKFKDYGKLSHRKLDELESGARVEVNQEKKNPQDFALWKHAEPSHLMHWPSPWGEGYPGWHIECSTMSIKYLGETFDIHGGGMENIFPHHDCEIAQSEAATGKPFVKYWMHNNMVTVDGVKMGKSLGNFITVKDALMKYSPETLRFFILSSHYRSNLDFSDEALGAAEKGLEKLLGTVRNLQKAKTTAQKTGSAASPIDLKEYRNRFIEMMDDDFNTPRAISVLFDLSRDLNVLLNSGQELRTSFLDAATILIQELAGEVLGLLPENLDESPHGAEKGSLEQVIRIAIDVRNLLRREKQYQLADQVREELGKAGIQLVDKPGGTDFEIR